MTAFIVFIVGISLIAFYFMYRQIYFSIIKTNKQFIIHTFCFTVFFVTMTYLGYLTSYSLKNTVGFSSHWISVAIFFIVGLKSYSNIQKLKSFNWTFDTNRFSTLIQFSLFRTFDAFFCGLALGFYQKFDTKLFIYFSVILLIVFLLSKAMAKRSTATNAVWVLAMVGSLILGLNAFVILISYFVVK